MIMEENIYSKVRNDFNNKYNTQILPLTKSLDKERKKFILLVLLCYLGLIFLGYIIYIISLNGSNSVSDKTACILLPLGLIIAGGCGVYLTIKKKFENKMKKELMPVVCSCFGDIVWSNPKYIRYGDVYKNSNILPHHTCSHIDDCFSGSYRNVKYRIEELWAEKGNVTVFQGVVILLEMNKKFKGNTVIRLNGILNYPDNFDLHRTVLEDIEFEKKFDVYTDDDVEARYLITPTLMERLKNMRVAFHADSVSAAFYDDRFFIALSTRKDLFSIGKLTKPLYDYKQFITMFEELYSIFALINYFKLDRKTGL